MPHFVELVVYFPIHWHSKPENVKFFPFFSKKHDVTKTELPPYKK